VGRTDEVLLYQGRWDGRAEYGQLATIQNKDNLRADDLIEISCQSMLQSTAPNTLPCTAASSQTVLEAGAGNTKKCNGLLPFGHIHTHLSASISRIYVCVTWR
jgi:hypothetical protein